MSSITYPELLRRPWVVIAAMLGGFLIPIGLEASGAIRSTWTLVDGGIRLSSAAVRSDSAFAIVSLVLAIVATVVMSGLLSAKLARANRDAQHRLVIQAWHLRQLLPAVPAPITEAV
jgi:hypothetical protein